MSQDQPLINTPLYQHHINLGIQKLENRRDKYLQHRLQFLNQFCNPIQDRINQLKQQIKYYEHMRDTQYQVIENQSDVLQLKGQIREYKQTKEYFEEKLDQYECSAVQLEEMIAQYEDVIMSKRLKIAGMAATMVNTPKRKNIQIKTPRSQIATPKPIQQHHQNPQKLPTITNRKPPSKYYIFARQNKYKTLLKNKNMEPTLEQSYSFSDVLKVTSQQDQFAKQQPSQKDIKKLISEYDRIQSLFRQCFERKKVVVQKSVTQLQSKLITNKQIFLKVCQKIGGGPQTQNQSLPLKHPTIRNDNKIAIQQFLELTPDQLMTIFISFGWLNRRIYAQFTNKRKNLIEGTTKKHNNTHFL